jgi:hypothetical protein
MNLALRPALVNLTDDYFRLYQGPALLRRAVSMRGAGHYD